MDISKLYSKIHELESLVEKIFGNQTIDIQLEDLFVVLNLKEFYKGRVVINSIKSVLLDEAFCSLAETFAIADVTKLKERGIIVRISGEIQSSLDCISRVGRTWDEISEIRHELITTSEGISKQEIRVLVGLIIKKREMLSGCIAELLSYFESIEEILEKVVMLPKHNMLKRIKCPITGEPCSKSSFPEINDVFVGLQFSSEYYNTPNLKEVLTEALKVNGLKPFFADEHFEPVHISCEICHKIQKVSICIFDISDSNPNVMFELGLACTQGKIAVLLAKQGSPGTKISDLAGFHRIQYGDLIDCRRLLINYFNDSRAVKECLNSRRGVI